MRFTEYYNLNLSQWEIDFVDIPIDSDIELFIDPYAISIENDDWSKECNEMLIQYFTLLIQSIKNSDIKKAKYLLGNLHEPNDIHLGMSAKESEGKGVGSRKAIDLYNSLIKSKAVKTGLLRDLSDCSLIIPGIGRDIISDISANIIRAKLIEFTQNQCKLHGIKIRKIQAGLTFNFKTEKWVNFYTELPFYNGRRIILVPKTIVRYAPTADARDYYKNFILDFLRTEHLKAGDSLVTTLKNGKKVVYKKDLEELYPYSKEYVQEFSKKYSKIFDNYRNERKSSPNPVLLNEEIELKQDDERRIDYDALLDELNKIETGTEDASNYHNYIFKVLMILFSPSLRNPTKEENLNEGRKRIDITFLNSRKPSFFSDLINVHSIKAPYIIIECKNYKSDLKNPELDQISGRLDDIIGRFGIITCRKIDNKDGLLKKTKDSLLRQQNHIIVLEDTDIIEMLKLKKDNKLDDIDSFLEEKLKKLKF